MLLFMYAIIGKEFYTAPYDIMHSTSDDVGQIVKNTNICIE